MSNSLCKDKTGDDEVPPGRLSEQLRAKHEQGIEPSTSLVDAF